MESNLNVKGLTFYSFFGRRADHIHKAMNVREKSTCFFDVLAGFLVNSSHWALFQSKIGNVLLSLSGRRSFRVNKSIDRG